MNELEESLARIRKKSSSRVFFLGTSRAGSWEVRGRQIAACRSNWDCGRSINWWTLRRYDIFVVVKKAEQKHIEMIRRSGKPLVYDIIDSWKQPGDSLRVTDLNQARDFFANAWKQRDADSYIFPNQQMREDLGDLVPHSTHIYHHYLPSLKPRPLPEQVSTLGYQGAKRFIQQDMDALEDVARNCRLELIADNRLEALNKIDIGIIQRSGVNNGFLERRYKSNVKLANFMACGIPTLIQAGTVSCVETWNEPESYFDSFDELETKLKQLVSDPGLRKKPHLDLIEHAAQFSIESIADQYDRYFESLPH